MGPVTQAGAAAASADLDRWGQRRGTAPRGTVRGGLAADTVAGGPAGRTSRCIAPGKRGNRARADPDADELPGRVQHDHRQCAAGRQRAANRHGTPAEVAADLLRYREAAGLDAFQINFHGNRDLDQLLQSMECFMREVKPRLA